MPSWLAVFAIGMGGFDKGCPGRMTGVTGQTDNRPTETRERKQEHRNIRLTLNFKTNSNSYMKNRREIFKSTGRFAAAIGLGFCPPPQIFAMANRPSQTNLFKISLAEWSLNRHFFAGRMDHLDLAQIWPREPILTSPEYVESIFSRNKAKDMELPEGE